MVITFKDKVISPLPEFENIEKGGFISLKTLQKSIDLPLKYKNWHAVLSLILELDQERDYQIQSEKDVFKITLKK